MKCDCNMITNEQKARLCVQSHPLKTLDEKAYNKHEKYLETTELTV